MLIIKIVSSRGEDPRFAPLPFCWRRFPLLGRALGDEFGISEEMLSFDNRLVDGPFYKSH